MRVQMQVYELRLWRGGLAHRIADSIRDLKNAGAGAAPSRVRVPALLYAAALQGTTGESTRARV